MIFTQNPERKIIEFLEMTKKLIISPLVYYYVHTVKCKESLDLFLKGVRADTHTRFKYFVSLFTT